MSGILAISCPEAAMLITDGAGYDDNGVLRTVEIKVTLAKEEPFAVSSRGHAGAGKVLQRSLCKWADQVGADTAVERLSIMVRQIATVVPIDLTGSNAVEVVIAAWTEETGGVCYGFHTGITGHGLPPYEIIRLPEFWAFGPAFKPEDAASMPVKRRDEAWPDYMKRAGADLLEVMRRRPASMAGKNDGTFFGVGGRCDLTTIDSKGARMETLRVWNDKIGRKVDPFGIEDAAAPILTRQQRRAQEREARRKRVA